MTFFNQLQVFLLYSLSWLFLAKTIRFLWDYFNKMSWAIGNPFHVLIYFSFFVFTLAITLDYKKNYSFELEDKVLLLGFGYFVYSAWTFVELWLAGFGFESFSFFSLWICLGLIGTQYQIRKDKHQKKL